MLNIILVVSLYFLIGLALFGIITTAQKVRNPDKRDNDTADMCLVIWPVAIPVAMGYGLYVAILWLADRAARKIRIAMGIK